MSKEEIIKIIETIDEQLKNNRKIGDAYIPPTKLLIDLKEWWKDTLLNKHGVSYE